MSPSFSHGSRARLYINGYDLSSYFKSVEASGELDTADTTGFGDTHRKFITGQADGKLSGSGMYENSAGAVESVLTAAFFDSASEITHWFNTDAVGNRGFGMQGAESTFNISTPVADVASIAFEAVSSTAFEGLWSLHNKALAVTAGTTFAGTVDAVAQTSVGAAGYLHSFAYGSAGTIAVTVQHSADGSTGWADILTFTNVTADNRSERTTTSGTVERYLRSKVIKTGAGTAFLSVSATKTPQL